MKITNKVYLEDFIEITRDDVAEIQDKLDNLILNLNELPELINPIRDYNNFMDHLRLEGLLTRDLEEFIDKYMRYYNE